MLAPKCQAMNNQLLQSDQRSQTKSSQQANRQLNDLTRQLNGRWRAAEPTAPTPYTHTQAHAHVRCNITRTSCFAVNIYWWDCVAKSRRRRRLLPLVWLYVRVLLQLAIKYVYDCRSLSGEGLTITTTTVTITIAAFTCVHICVCVGVCGTVN